jgi:hypothetical protein
LHFLSPFSLQDLNQLPWLERITVASARRRRSQRRSCRLANASST